MSTKRIIIFILSSFYIYTFSFEMETNIKQKVNKNMHKTSMIKMAKPLHNTYTGGKKINIQDI